MSGYEANVTIPCMRVCGCVCVCMCVYINHAQYTILSAHPYLHVMVCLQVLLMSHHHFIVSHPLLLLLLAISSYYQQVCV